MNNDLEEFDFLNPSKSSVASLRRHYELATTEWEQMKAISFASLLKLNEFDAEVREILATKNKNSQLFVGAWSYAAEKGWFSRKEWEEALNWEWPGICGAALWKIGILNLSEYTDHVYALGKAPSEEDQHLLEMCKLALKNPTLAGFFLRGPF